MPVLLYLMISHISAAAEPDAGILILHRLIEADQSKDDRRNLEAAASPEAT